MTEIPKTYDPKATEEVIYKKWLDSGFFNPDVCICKGVTFTDAEPFVISLPPPNVTGVLHIGHAYEDSLQDAIIRYQRMRGKRTLWIPGADSAATTTQSRVEKKIQKEEGKNRHDIGRDELVRRVSEYAKSSENTILSQIQKLGASLDWSRYAYTLDKTRNKAVTTAFKRMFDSGLIYRGNRIVNWDPKGQTVISDDEVVYEERDTKLYTFKYSKDFPISIATTRLETKVGDTAVAVHPDDVRYKKYVGKEYDVVFYDIPLHIKIVADKSVDMEFGTGALGVTPAHSQIDWEIADRNNLLRPQVINEYARMMVAGALADKKTMEAREMIAVWLKDNDLLEKEEDAKQNISISGSTGGIIEPLPKLQWFINVNESFVLPYSEINGISSKSETTLKKIMRAAVENGDINMPQENFKKSYFHWIDNLHDWCISRQIWFGHRIPIWYRNEEIYCEMEAPVGNDWQQDSDVLDTWFSSALWTFSTLGWPEKTKDLTTFHPTSLMSPAYEILFLWVSRMILMSGFHLGQVPFKKVFIHGLLRDSKGRKFSKSLDNGVDPIDIIDRYGADALRMGLLVGTAIGNDLKFDENKIKGYKNFANKLWNIARFVLMQSPDKSVASAMLSDADQLILTDLKKFIHEVTGDMEALRLYMAAEKIYHYIWHTFADKIIEESKAKLQSEDVAIKQSAQRMIREILETCLKLLHPFMPFVTESIWEILSESKKPEDLLIIQKWPTQ